MSARKRRHWTPIEDGLLREFYPDYPACWLSECMDRSTSSIYARAAHLGLQKSEEFKTSRISGRLGANPDRGKATRFPKGHVPHNKGLRRPGYAPGRMAETQFKSGRPPQQARNYRPIGSTRVVYGNLERKISDDRSVYPAKRWRPVHRLVWESAHGPVPKGHVVVFKPGRHTRVEELITLDRLECITRRELMRRNSVHNRYPEPVRQAIRTRAQLVRKIRSIQREKQNRRPAQSPVRDAGASQRQG